MKLLKDYYFFIKALNECYSYDRLLYIEYSHVLKSAFPNNKLLQLFL